MAVILNQLAHFCFSWTALELSCSEGEFLVKNFRFGRELGESLVWGWLQSYRYLKPNSLLTPSQLITFLTKNSPSGDLFSYIRIIISLIHAKTSNAFIACYWKSLGTKPKPSNSSLIECFIYSSLIKYCCVTSIQFLLN